MVLIDAIQRAKAGAAGNRRHTLAIVACFAFSGGKFVTRRFQTFATISARSVSAASARL
jgi:hypothetical protein